MDESRQKPSFPQPSGAGYLVPPAEPGPSLPVPCPPASFAPAPCSSAPCPPSGLKYGPSKSLLLTRPRSGCERAPCDPTLAGDIVRPSGARPWLKRQEPGPADPTRYMLALTAQADEPFFPDRADPSGLQDEGQEARLSSDVLGVRGPQAARRCQARTTWRDDSSHNCGSHQPRIPGSRRIRQPSPSIQGSA